MTAQRCHQVTDISPAPAPTVTEYMAQGEGVRELWDGDRRRTARTRAGPRQFGPETCAQAGNLVCGHHIPVYRATVLLCQLAGIAVPAGWMAGIPRQGRRVARPAG